MMDLITINAITNGLLVLIGGGAFGVWLLHRREMPKAKAAAQLTQSEADDRDWGRFQKEIGRLEERIARQDDEIENLRNDALKSRRRESNLEQTVRSQKAHISRVERRLAGIERIFKLHGVTPEMQIELDRLEEVSISLDGDDPDDSRAMSQAKSTKRDTKRADDSARETCEEVERTEDKGKRRK